MGFFLRRGYAPPPLLGEIEAGRKIIFNESGSPAEFYVSKHDYESGLNGAGRTLLVRESCVKEGVYNSGGSWTLDSSTIYEWLNGTYLQTLDAEVQAAIGKTKYYFNQFRNSGEEYAMATQNAVFILSMKELGFSNYVGGSILPIASILQAAYLNGQSGSQWTRTRTSNKSRAMTAAANGVSTSLNVANNTAYYRPVFTLPADFVINRDMLV